MSAIGGNFTAPADEAVVVVPSDTVNLANPSRALYIGVSGDVTVDLVKLGTNVTFKSVPVGFFPLRVTRVYATGTTATNIIAVS